MKKLILLTIVLTYSIFAQVSINSNSFTYTQDFNSLSTSGTTNTWTNNATISGWYSTRALYIASSGTSTAGGLYSFGSAADRAIGSIASGSTGTVYFGVAFTNNTGAAITSLTIGYKGEQWRNGGNTTSHTLSFSYQANATDISAGTWTAASDLNFTGPVASPTAAAVDGNANGSTLSKTITGLNIANGETIWFRWEDPNDAGNDHGLGVDDFTLSYTGAVSLTPPVLTADITLNNVDNNIDITFTDDATWRAAASSVKVNGNALTASTDYELTAGQLRLKPAGGNVNLTASGSKTVTVEATGYSVASVTQQIDAGAATSNSTAIIDVGLVSGTTGTVTATAKDQYNNLVPNYTFKYDATITNSNSANSESYTIDGTARTSNASNINLTTQTNASGVATFTIVIPATVDGGDGLSVQVQLTDGITNVGSAFTFTKAPAQITLTGSDPNAAAFAQGSTNNVLYRVQMDVVNDNTLLNSAKFTTGGNYTSSDLVGSGFKLWLSTNNTFEATDTQIGSLSSTSTGSGETLNFTSLNQSVLVGSSYLFLTVDVSGAASLTKSISVQSSANADYNFSFSPTFSGSAFGSGGSHVFAPPIPAAPIAQAATSLTPTGFTTNWNASSGATKYFLDVSTSNTFAAGFFVGTYNNKDVGNVTSEAITGLTANKNYYYRVRAGNITGTSANSNQITVVTPEVLTQALSAGDIAIIGINTDDPDQFTFVPLVDLDPGTVIRFTDSGVRSSGSFRGSEGCVKFTSPSTGIVAGTIITYTSPASGYFSLDNDATVGTSGMAISTSGDQVVAFQGSSTSPNFLYALTTYRGTWDSDATSTNNSALPPGLINGITAIAVGAASADNDDAAYNMSITMGNKNELLNAIGDKANWTTSDTYLAMPSGSFNVVGGSSNPPSAPVAIAATNITSKGFTANWQATSNTIKYYLDVATDDQFASKVTGYNNKDVGLTTSASISGLTGGTQYFYRVRASNSVGSSPNSNAISVTTAPLKTYVQFVSPTGSATENAGIFNLTLSIVDPSPTVATTFQVALTGGTGTAADINNYTTQTVTFPAGSSSNQTLTIVLTNDNVTEGNETLSFAIQNVTGGINAGVGTQSTFTLTLSDPKTDYYSNVNTTLNSAAFKTELNNLIKGHVAFPYSASTTDIWDILSAAYEDPANSNNVILIYTGRSQAKTYNASTASNDQNAWNREHVFAQSRGGFDVNNNSQNPGVASDAHNLAPEDASVNSARGNKDFDIGGNPVAEAVGSFMDSDSFEPRDAVKGDVARILFYMDTRYEGNGEVQLELRDGVNTSAGTIGKLSTLLQWHQQDPPDAFEMKRNDVIYSYQKNKNPFIDHPEWVAKIYGSAASTPPTIANITRSIKVPAENQDVSITASVSDNGTITSAQLIYTINNGAEQTINMSNASGTLYFGLIPEAAYSDGNLLQYKVKAVDNDGEVSVSPFNKVFVGTTPIASLHPVDATGLLNYNGIYAKVTGTATVASGTFSTTNLEVNLQDASGGLVIYKSTAGSKAIAVGKNYSVTGALTQYNGLTELVPDNATTDVVDEGTTSTIQPTLKTFAELLANPEVYEGMLIRIRNVNKVSGTWTNSSNLVVTDGTSDAVTFRISSGTNLSTNPEPVWPKDVVGVFTQFDATSPYLDGYQIKPRAISDIQTVSVAATPTKYILTTSNNNPVAGTSITVTAQLVDANNVSVLTAGKIVSWNSTNGGTFSSATSTTDATGKATINFTVSSTGNTTQLISVSDNTTPVALTGNTTVITQAPVPAKYLVTASNYNPPINGVVTITAQLVDASNNVAAFSGKVITWSSTNGGTFSGPTSTTDATGKATINFTVSNNVSVVHSVTALDNTTPSSLSGTSSAITTSAIEPAGYVITLSNKTPVVSSSIQANIQLVDVYGNPVTQQGRIITWSVTNNGVLSGTKSTIDEKGKAQITLTVSNKAGVEYIISAVDDAAIPFKTSSETIKTIAGEAVKYLVVVSNNKPSVGSQIIVSAQLSDVFGNSVSVAGKTITWAKTNGGTFTSAQSLTDVNGKAENKFTVSSTAGIVHKISVTDNSSLTGSSEDVTTVAIESPKLISPANKTLELPITINLVWSVVQNAELYELNVAEDSLFTQNVTKYENLTATNKEVSGLTKGTNYYWRVRSKGGSLFSDWSKFWTFGTVFGAPAKPVLALPENNSTNTKTNLTLSWNNVAGAKTYTIVIAEDIQFTKIAFDKTGLTSNSFSAATLKNSQKYFWKVKADNDAGSGDYSDVWNFTTVEQISAPTELTANADANFNISLSWKDNSANETAFILERMDAGNSQYYQFDRVAANTTSYLNSGLEQGKTYTFRIKAINDLTESAYSNTLTIVVPRANINAPTLVKVVTGSGGSVIVSWKDNSTDEIGFIIFREELTQNKLITSKYAGVNVGMMPIDTVNANTTVFVDKTSQVGKTYQYQVVTLTTAGVSIPTPAALPLKILSAPTGLKAALDGTNIKLTWIDNSIDENGFVILRAIKPLMNYQPIDTTLANEITFVDKSVFDGRKFYYKAYAMSNQNGMSAETNLDSLYIAMKAPTTLKAVQQTNQNKINLTWVDNSASENGYIIERKETGQANFVEIATVLSNVNAYTDATVTNKKNYSYRVKGYNEDGASAYSPESSILVGVEKDSDVPVAYSLKQNYPNPFNPSTTISYSIPERAFVRLRIVDLLGSEIIELINQEQQAGTYRFLFNAQNLSSGTYFYILEAGNYRDVKKLILVK